MFPALALAIALNVLQPADTRPARPAPPLVSEATPAAVPPATSTALRYYTSGNRLWVLDQVLSIVIAQTNHTAWTAMVRRCATGRYSGTDGHVHGGAARKVRRQLRGPGEKLATASASESKISSTDDSCVTVSSSST
jgi:hypothetical protein